MKVHQRSTWWCICFEMTLNCFAFNLTISTTRRQGRIKANLCPLFRRQVGKAIEQGTAWMRNRWSTNVFISRASCRCRDITCFMTNPANLLDPCFCHCQDTKAYIANIMSSEAEVAEQWPLKPKPKLWLPLATDLETMTRMWHQSWSAQSSACAVVRLVHA